jgi:1,4-dihydroxy-2-naphthoyl-CoA synthase
MMTMRKPTGGVDVRLETRPSGIIARVTLDNERKLNTLNTPLMIQFVEEMKSLARKEELRAVVLTGAGARAFIGGADIEEMAELDPVTARRFITRLHECCDILRVLPVPVLARIEGFALGAGMEVAAACDLRIASETARFGMPEVKLGIPSVVEAALLPMLVGWGRTRQILLLGEIFHGRASARVGLRRALRACAGTRRGGGGMARSVIGLRPAGDPSAEAAHFGMGIAVSNRGGASRHRGFLRRLAIAGTEARHGELPCRQGRSQAGR